MSETIRPLTHPLKQRSLIKGGLPNFHVQMINDDNRNKMFYLSILKNIKPGMTVLDIGSGTGLLSMMAAKSGARHVTTCEHNTEMAKVCKTIIAANHLDHVIKVVNKSSFDLTVRAVQDSDMEERADALICEVVGNYFLAEEIISVVEHAKQNLLRPDPIIIPKRGVIYGQMIESHDLFKRFNMPATVEGFDLSAFNVTIPHFTLHENTYGQFKPLTDPFVIFDFDLTTEIPRTITQNVNVRVTQSGVAHCILVFFDIHLDDTTVLHANEPTSHWRRTIVPVMGAKFVHVNSKGSFNVKYSYPHSIQLL